MIITGTSYASRQGLFVAQNAFPTKVTCSTSTATLLFSKDGAVEEVGYKNNKSETIYIATYPATSITGNNVWPILAGEGIFLSFPSCNYGIATSTTNADLNLMIVK